MTYEQEMVQMLHIIAMQIGFVIGLMIAIVLKRGN